MHATASKENNRSSPLSLGYKLTGILLVFDATGGGAFEICAIQVLVSGYNSDLNTF